MGACPVMVAFPGHRHRTSDSPSGQHESFHIGCSWNNINCRKLKFDTSRLINASYRILQLPLTIFTQWRTNSCWQICDNLTLSKKILKWRGISTSTKLYLIKPWIVVIHFSVNSSIFIPCAHQIWNRVKKYQISKIRNTLDRSLRHTNVSRTEVEGNWSTQPSGWEPLGYLTIEAYCLRVVRKLLIINTTFTA